MCCRCLTCDREMKTQSGGNNSSERQQKGKFLPKLDSVQGKPTTPAGPGLNAAEIRSWWVGFLIDVFP